MQFKNINVLK